MSCMQFLVGSLPSALRSTRQAQIGQDGKPFAEHSQAEVGRVFAKAENSGCMRRFHSQPHSDAVHQRGRHRLIAAKALAVWLPNCTEAVFALQESIGTAEVRFDLGDPRVLWNCFSQSQDIDKTMKLGTNVPMGPLTLAAAGLQDAMGRS